MLPSAGNLRAYKIYTSLDVKKMVQATDWQGKPQELKGSKVLVFCYDEKPYIDLFGERGKIYAIMDTTIYCEEIRREKGGKYVGGIKPDKVRELLDIPSQYTPLCYLVLL